MKRILRRRRQECKTDYNARIPLLVSGKPRIIVRKTNRYIIAQIVESKSAQDKILFGVTSKDLLEKGWPKESAGSLKSRAAAYLTGLLLAKKASGKTKEAILDIGLNRNIKKSRIFSTVKGAIDGGLKIPCNPESLPSMEEINSNEKVSNIFDKIKQKI